VDNSGQAAVLAPDPVGDRRRQAASREGPDCRRCARSSARQLLRPADHHRHGRCSAGFDYHTPLCARDISSDRSNAGFHAEKPAQIELSCRGRRLTRRGGNGRSRSSGAGSPAVTLRVAGSRCIILLCCVKEHHTRQLYRDQQALAIGDCAILADVVDAIIRENHSVPRSASTKHSTT
jgi:hypothetical protein